MATVAKMKQNCYDNLILRMRLEDNLNSLHAGDRINEFSVSMCDCCRTRLAGERFEVVGLPISKRSKNGLGKPIKYSVCLECFEEIAGIVE